MADTMEQRMVCAHKQGRMMSIFARNMTRSAVEQEARLLFSYVQEREAFMAGYEGERRRRAELVRSTLEQHNRVARESELTRA
jgi:hypothetical protein